MRDEGLFHTQPFMFPVVRVPLQPHGPLMSQIQEPQSLKTTAIDNQPILFPGQIV
jgi:hypothetical protein